MKGKLKVVENGNGEISSQSVLVILVGGIITLYDRSICGKEMDGRYVEMRT